MQAYRTLTKTECGRCGVEVREGKRRHFCGEPYPLKATEDIREVVYVSQVALADRLALDGPLSDADPDYRDGWDAAVAQLRAYGERPADSLTPPRQSPRTEGDN